jgi:hypothetical protein
MGTGCGPIGSLQGYREGAGCGVKEKKKPFSRLTREHHVLVRGQFRHRPANIHGAKTQDLYIIIIITVTASNLI